VSNQYDIIILGAGLDGLVAATYLAKSGRSVLVLEANSEVGGSHRTVEFSPGFRCPGAIDSINELHPSIAKDLGLKDLGLKEIKGGGLALIDADGLSLRIDETGVLYSREDISEADQSEYASFRSFVLELSEALKPALTQALANPKIDRLSGLADLLHLGWALRRLGKKKMPEALRFLPTNIRDLMEERFESRSMKALITAETLRGTRMAPRFDGSALALVHRSSFWAGGVGAKIRVTEGGPGTLSGAIEAAAVAAGAEIRTSADVASVAIVRDEVRAVLLADGTRIEAETVVSTLDPKHTLLKLAGPRWFEPDFVEKVTQIRGRGALSIVRLALDSLPAIKGGVDSQDALKGRLFFASEINDIERAFDATKYEEIPDKPFLSATIPSMIDPSLAPEGKHVMNVWVHFTPYDLRDGSWSEQHGHLLGLVKSQLEDVMPGISESILASQVLTPPDLEAAFAAPQGCLDHVEVSLDQILYMRPIPGWFNYTTPIKGLLMCGPGTHPGGQSGLSGKTVASELS